MRACGMPSDNSLTKGEVKWLN